MMRFFFDSKQPNATFLYLAGYTHSHELKNNNKKPAAPPPKKARKSWGYIVPVIFALGIVVGYIANGFSKAKKPSRQIQSVAAPTQSVGKTLHQTISYPFLSPLVNDQIYRNLNLCFTEELEQKVKNYIHNNVRNGEEVAVYFRDLNSNYRFGINETSKFSPSSLMKVPIMIAALKKAQDEPRLLNDLMVYKGSRENQEKGMESTTPRLQTMLVEGRQYTVLDLIRFMILDSDNEATILLLDRLSEKYVHQVERDLGFVMDESTSFYGDVIGVKKYSSFFRVLYNASYLNEEMSNIALEILSASRYGNGIRKGIPKEIIVAHKFGRNGVPVSSNQLQVNQLHHFGIVYSHPKPFLLGIMVRGNEDSRMEKQIRDITQIVYSEIQNTIQSSCRYIDRDIN